MKLTLNEDVKDDDNNPFAKLSVTLLGDGATPNVQTELTHQLVGYNDFGQPVYANIDQKKLETEQQMFMAKAIAVQKSLTQANGINPDVVNVIGAELGGQNNATNN